MAYLLRIRIAQLAVLALIVATAWSPDAFAGEEGDGTALEAEKQRASYRYAQMTAEEAYAELDRRGVPYAKVSGRVPGVLAPVRLTDKLHGVHIHSSLPEEKRAESVFEILDARLALALDDFALLLERHEIVEAVHYTMYRPNGPKPGSEHDHEAVAKDEPRADSKKRASNKRSKNKRSSQKRAGAKRRSSKKKTPSLGKGAKNKRNTASARRNPTKQKTSGKKKPAAKPTKKKGPSKKPADASKPSQTSKKAGSKKKGGSKKADAKKADAKKADAKKRASENKRSSSKKRSGNKRADTKRSKGGKRGEKASAAEQPVKKVAYSPPGTRHPAGLAIDIGGFRKRDGRWLGVAQHFKGKIGRTTCGPGATPTNATESRELWSIACESVDAGVFTYVLTPNYDEAHFDHFHMEIRPEVTWYWVK